VTLLANLPEPHRVLAAAGGPDWLAQAAFIGAFVALIVILVSLPATMLGETESRPPLWRSVRAWAVLVAVVQILVYAFWG